MENSCTFMCLVVCTTHVTSNTKTALAIIHQTPLARDLRWCHEVVERQAGVHAVAASSHRLTSSAKCGRWWFALDVHVCVVFVAYRLRTLAPSILGKHMTNDGVCGGWLLWEHGSSKVLLKGLQDWQRGWEWWPRGVAMWFSSRSRPPVLAAMIVIIQGCLRRIQSHMWHIFMGSRGGAPAVVLAGGIRMHGERGAKWERGQGPICKAGISQEW